MTLPALVSLEDMPGADSAAKWPVYLECIYHIFRKQVVEAGLIFQGLPIKCRYQKPYAVKHASFWHLMSEGEIEEQRTPDFDRCARIPWIAPVIGHADDPSVVRWWKHDRATTRGTKIRVVLWLFQHDYAVILEPREGCCFLITTYCVRPGQKLKFEKEWKAWTG